MNQGVKYQFYRVCFLLLLLNSILSCRKDSKERPEVQFISPLGQEGSKVLVGDTLNIIAQAIDPDGTISHVACYVSDSMIGKLTSAPYIFSYIFNYPGDYLLSLIATDEQNNQSEKVDHLVSVTDGGKIDFNFEFEPDRPVSTKDALLIHVDAFSRYGKIVNIKLYLNNQLWEEDTRSFLRKSLVDFYPGVYNIHAVAVDEVGNIGKSHRYTFTVDEIRPIEISFDIHPIYLENMFPGSSLNVSFNLMDRDNDLSHIELFLNDSLVHVFDPAMYDYGIDFEKGGSYTLRAIAYSKSGQSQSTDELTFLVHAGLVYDERLKGIVSSVDNQSFYAINVAHSKLVVLTSTNGYCNEIRLPYYIPSDISYARTGRKVYISYKFDDIISIWDEQSASFSSISFNGFGGTDKLLADEINQRIYVKSSDALLILEMGSGEVLSVISPFEVDDFVIDNENQWLFATRSLFQTQFFKYSLINDQLELIQTHDNLGYEPNGLYLNTKKEYIIPLGNTGMSNIDVKAYSVHDIESLYGNFEANDPISMGLSGNNEQLFILNGMENKICVHNATSFEREVCFELHYNHFYFGEVIVNNSGTLLLYHTEISGMEDDRYMLCFYNIAQ